MQLSVPVIGILRGISFDFFGDVMASSFDAGLQSIEVTFNTDRAEEIISAHRKHLPPGKMLGMGTIRNMEEARKAVFAGAMFIVTPNTDPKVIAYATSQKVPVIAGGFTPSEVYAAWSAGAAMVKVFPCGMFGPQYIRELHGPFEQIPLAAVGGVNIENVGTYFNAGAAAVGVGTSLFGRDALKDRSPEAIYTNVKRFLDNIQS
jgi:2-dehydro-3-deoxyphosphogluconate aldolase / (4S)-4-hydroxy-2-oxoglutarate aldolase